MTIHIKQQLKQARTFFIAIAVIFLISGGSAFYLVAELQLLPLHWLVIALVASSFAAGVFFQWLHKLANKLLLVHQQVEQSMASLETEAEHKEGVFKAITDQSTEGITVADTAGNYTFVNPAFCKMVGYSEAELLQMSVFDMKAPEQDHTSFERTKSSQEGLSVEVVLQRKDGSVFVSEVIGQNVTINGSAQVLGTVRDISDYVKAEEKIRTLSQAVEQSPISIMILSVAGIIQYVNSAFERVTGYKSVEVNGESMTILIPDGLTADFQAGLASSMAKGEIWEGEMLIRKKTGDTFWEYVHFSPVRDEYNKIIHYLGVKEDISLRKEHEEKILHQAHFDVLTNLPNRFLSLDRLSQMLSEAVRNNESAALLFIDLDDFKKVNDSLGHEMGDKLLIEAAARLKSVVREGDTVGRLGGDEFIVLLGGLENPANAQLTAENLLDRFRDAFCVDGRELMMTATVGIAVYPGDGDSASELLRSADAAMYHAKELGRNTYSFFTEEMNKLVTRRLSLEEQIHGALDRGEFEVIYQPQVEVGSSQIVGVEALLRWHNPALGDVPPDEFIPVAEQTGLIISIGQFVLAEALRNAANWQKNYRSDFRMAVNFSPRQFRDPNLVTFIKRTVDEYGLSGKTLELEITEGVLMSGQRYIYEIFEALKGLGVCISMDDFGTGYSSLSYLRNYSFDLLKIDRSFVNDITVDPADRELINAAIKMAHSLQLKVVAEGVETDAQLDYLKALGCDYAQGYLFGKPMPVEELTGLLMLEKPC